MSETPKFIKQLVDGWPVYSAVALFLLAYSQLWIDARVDARIAFAAVGQPTVASIDKKVGEHTVKLEGLAAGQLRIEGSLGLLTAHALGETPTAP